MAAARAPRKAQKPKKPQKLTNATFTVGDWDEALDRAMKKLNVGSISEYKGTDDEWAKLLAEFKTQAEAIAERKGGTVPGLRSIGETFNKRVVQAKNQEARNAKAGAKAERAKMVLAATRDMLDAVSVYPRTATEPAVPWDPLRLLPPATFEQLIKDRFQAGDLVLASIVASRPSLDGVTEDAVVKGLGANYHMRLPQGGWVAPDLPSPEEVAHFRAKADELFPHITARSNKWNDKTRWLALRLVVPANVLLAVGNYPATVKQFLRDYVAVAPDKKNKMMLRINSNIGTSVANWGGLLKQIGNSSRVESGICLVSTCTKAPEGKGPAPSHPGGAGQCLWHYLHVRVMAWKDVLTGTGQGPPVTGLVDDLHRRYLKGEW